MNLKKEKGSIAVFVLVALLFMAAFLIILYASNVNKSKVIKEQFDIISDIYAYTGGEESVYDKTYTDLRKKNKQTMKASVENTSTIELTNTFNEPMSNYRIYGNETKLNNDTTEEPANLPEEYQQLEYIESTGTQYILTDIIPDDTTGIKIELDVTDTTGDTLFFRFKNNNNR